MLGNETSGDLVPFLRANLPDAKVADASARDVGSIVQHIIVAGPIFGALWVVLKQWLESRPKARVKVSYLAMDGEKVEVEFTGMNGEEVRAYLAGHPPSAGASVRLAATEAPAGAKG